MMSEQENMALIRQGWAMINEGDWEAVEAVHSDDWVGSAPDGQELFTLAEVAFPDLRVTIEEMVASGDKVVSRFTLRGTHRGEFLGIAPTGKPVTTSGIVINRIVDGQIVADWEEYDRLGLMRQIGAIPATL